MFQKRILSKPKWGGHKQLLGSGDRLPWSPRNDDPGTDPLEAKDRNARGQGPRTRALVF